MGVGLPEFKWLMTAVAAAAAAAKYLSARPAGAANRTRHCVLAPAPNLMTKTCNGSPAIIGNNFSRYIAPLLADGNMAARPGSLASSRALV